MSSSQEMHLDVALEGSSHRTSEEEALQPKIDLDEHKQVSTQRDLWVTLLIQTACLAWTVPIIYLLYLNFGRKLVGASAWCPDHQCEVGWFNSITSEPEQRLRRYDKRDHNLLGVLQLVAKVLEVWFELIAAALVYLITFLIAGKKEGLPVGYLTRPNEFAEVPGLFDPLLWRLLPSPFRATSASGHRLRRRLYLFVSLTIFLCIVCNLMGPAAAVLAIPSLQWIDTPRIGNRAFGAMGASQQPIAANGSWFWDSIRGDCMIENITRSEYSCAAARTTPLLDSWIETYIAAGAAGAGPSGLTQEEGVYFAFNLSYQSVSKGSREDDLSNVTLWIPNRQVLHNLTQDLNVIALNSLGYSAAEMTESSLDITLPTDSVSTYTEYNEALELIVQRDGPILGTVGTMWSTSENATYWTTDVASDRWVRCYSWYDLFWTPLAEDTTLGNYTKCIKIGSGWGEYNKHANFSINGETSASSSITSPSILVDIWTSDRAVFLPPDVVPPACLAAGQAPSSCDYDAIFNINSTDPEIRKRSANVTTIEMSVDYETRSAILVSDFVAFLNFTTYTLDPSPLTNPLALVQTQFLPDGGVPIHVDPAWILAAWSADDNGTIESNRPSTRTLRQELNKLSRDPLPGLRSRSEWEIDYISLLPVIQTLSLIDYSTVAATTTDLNKASQEGHPLLQRNAKLWVWAYGFSSRTSKMGAAVAISGVLVVLVQFVLGFVDGRKYRSPTQLLVAALEHVPVGEFQNFKHDETRVAKVAFHVKETYTGVGVGNLSFHSLN